MLCSFSRAIASGTWMPSLFAFLATRNPAALQLLKMEDAEYTNYMEDPDEQPRVTTRPWTLDAAERCAADTVDLDTTSGGTLSLIETI